MTTVPINDSLRMTVRREGATSVVQVQEKVSGSWSKTEFRKTYASDNKVNIKEDVVPEFEAWKKHQKILNGEK